MSGLSRGRVGDGAATAPVAIALAVSAGLSLLGMDLLCLLPLQWVYHKAGQRAGFLCGSLALGLSAGGQLAASWILLHAVGWDYWLSVGVLAPSVLALMALNGLAGKGAAPWARLLAAYAVNLAAAAGIVAWVTGDPAASAKVGDYIKSLLGLMLRAPVDADLAAATLQGMAAVLPLTLSFWVACCWYAATWFWRRRFLRWSAASALANFRIAEYMVWPLLFGLGLLVYGLAAPVPPPLRLAAQWLSLGMGFLYFLQGLGVIAYQFERRKNPGARSLPLPLVCAIPATLPLVNVVFLLGVAFLGVLELWVRMRPATHA